MIDYNDYKCIFNGTKSFFVFYSILYSFAFLSRLNKQ